MLLEHPAIFEFFSPRLLLRNSAAPAQKVKQTLRIPADTSCWNDFRIGIKIGLDLRREVFGSRAVVADALAAIGNKFLTMGGQLESKIASIDGQMAALQRSLEQGQAQLPMDGQVVKESFAKLASEIKNLQLTTGEPFTKQMCGEFEFMRQHVVAHEHRIAELSGGDAHQQMLIVNLGLAYAQHLAATGNFKTHTL